MILFKKSESDKQLKRDSRNLVYIYFINSI